jgi:large subunit ribosomal protein L22
MLKTSNKRAAKPIEITLRSAIANAEQKDDQFNVAIDVDRLKISNATVDLGPTKYRRRVRPAPMGRAYRERRWQSHITIEVESEKE